MVWLDRQNKAVHAAKTWIIKWNVRQWGFKVHI